MNRVRHYFCVIVLAVSPFAAGRSQEVPSWSIGYGLVQLRMLGAEGLGGEINGFAPLPIRSLKGGLGVRGRAWHANLGRGNAWMNEVRVTGVGLGPAIEWSFLGARLRSHLEAPVGLTYVRTFGLQDLSDVCVTSAGTEVCELSGRDLALTAALGAGMSIRIYDVFYIGASVRRFWSRVARSQGAREWLSHLGFEVRWGGG